MKQNQIQARGSLRPPTQLKSKLTPPTQVGSSSPQKNSQKDLGILNPSNQSQIPIPQTNQTPQSATLQQNPLKQRANTIMSPATSTSSKFPQQPQINPPYQNVQLFLHKVIGMSSFNNENFAIISSSIVGYLAANVIVILDIYQNKQLMLFHNQNNKAYRVLKFFPEEQWLIAGEGNTKQGEIQVFSVLNNKSGFLMMHFMTLKGHKYGIRNFDLQDQLLVSIGDENDKGMLVWDLRQQQLISANLSKKSLILSLSFIRTQQNNMISYITCGTDGHLKKWNIQKVKNEEGEQFKIVEAQNKEGQKIPKQKSQKLQISGSNNEIEYQRVVDNKDGVFVLAFKNHQHKIIKLEKKTFTWVNEIALDQHGQDYNFHPFSENLLVLGCQNGQTKLIDTHSCKFSNEIDLSWTKPLPKDQFQKITKDIYDYLNKAQQQKQKYANIISVKCEQGLITQILDDGMVLIHSLESKQLIRLLYSHNDLINDLTIKDYGQWDENITFFTGSKDNSLRVWNVDLSNKPSKQHNPIEGDLKRVIFLEDDSNTDFKQGGGGLEEERGIKTISYNQMRNQLAVGDMKGNIRIYQLSSENNQSIHKIKLIEAHEGKVVALCYSEPFAVPNTDDYVQYLVSASSDRMIHIFNALNDEYDLVQTIDASTSSIVDVRISKCTVGVKNKNKVVSQEKQLRVYACSTDKSLLSSRYSPNDEKFLPLPKDINKNKINSIALTDQLIILAKDQGLIEVKQIDTMKTVQQAQNSLQNQSLNKNLLEYLRMDLSYDEQLIVLCDKEKSVQVREVRSVDKQLSKLFITDHLSSVKFSSDNKFVLCSSINPKETGGGIIYVLKLEHAQDQIKQKNKIMSQIRNSEDLIVIDVNDVEKVQHYSAMRNSQIGDAEKILPQIKISSEQVKQDVQVRQFQVNDELFNTWAKSTNVQEEEKKEVEKKEEKKKFNLQLQNNSPIPSQKSPTGPNRPDKLFKQQQALAMANDDDDMEDEKLEDEDELLKDIVDKNNKDDEENLLDNDINLDMDDIAPKDIQQEEIKRQNSNSQLRRNSLTQRYKHNPTLEQSSGEKLKEKTPRIQEVIPKASIGTDNIANESKNDQLLKEISDLEKQIKDKTLKLRQVQNLSQTEKQKLLLSINQMMKTLFEVQEIIIR